MNTPLIEIKNLSAGYDSRTVLRNVNLTVYDRDLLGTHRPQRWRKNNAHQVYSRPAETHNRRNFLEYSDKRSVASDKQRGTAQRPALTTNRSVLKMGYLLSTAVAFDL